LEFVSSPNRAVDKTFYHFLSQFAWSSNFFRHLFSTRPHYRSDTGPFLCSARQVVQIRLPTHPEDGNYSGCQNVVKPAAFYLAHSQWPKFCIEHQPRIVKESEIGRTCDTDVGDTKCIQNLLGKSEVKRPFGHAQQRWEDNAEVGLKETWSWGSSVSIVSEYRLDDRVSISGRGKGLFLYRLVQTSSGAYPGSYPIGTMVFSRG
jgi:hypothetical protein